MFKTFITITKKMNIQLIFSIAFGSNYCNYLIGNFIASTVKSWNADEVSDKIEAEIGKDLQYIRLNGTIIGGCIGLVIYTISAFLG